jgi:cyclic-di-AMP phosphodiesterase PgpH
MSFFGTRRTRQTRVFRPTPSVWEKVSTALQDYRILTLVLLTLFAVLILQIAMQSWRSPFSYREGQISSSGVQARTDFSIKDVKATERERFSAEQDARLVFIQNNDFWTDFYSRFRKELTDVANASDLASVPTEVADSFGLATVIPADQEKGTAPTTRFELVKSVLAESDIAIGVRLEQMELEFSALLYKPRETGILDDGGRASIGLSEDRLTPQRPIEIVDNMGKTISYNLLVHVTLEDQLLETGSIGQAWPTSPNLVQIRPAVEHWLRARLKGQLTYDKVTTAERIRESADAVADQYDLYPKGRVLVDAGSQIDLLKIERLREEYNAHEMTVTLLQRCARFGGSTLVVSLMVLLFGVYLQRSEPQLLEEVGQLVALIFICSTAVFLSCWLSLDPWRAEVVPLLAAVMILSVVHNQLLAILTSFCLSLLITMSTVGTVGHFSVLMALSFAAIVPLRQVSSRSTIIKIGVGLAFVAFISVWGINLIGSNDFPEAWQDPTLLMLGLKFGVWSLLCCFIVGGILPFIETAFGIVTDMSLLELTDVSHPLLQELSRRAPGTYNHSISVASIGEAAADAIGANGLLLRVGAYFHDIGKGLKPGYFIENMTEGQENPHDNLAPAMSALIIIGHVKDGIEMAEQHNLPRKLIDFIEQHHGTTLVEYFFREATNRADEDHRTDADESTFRYPGAKPQSKETGVMMLSDAVESASRTLSEPTPKRIQSLVNEITLKRILDGQFDESGLTMTELRVIQKSLVKSLLAVHHGRIKYPDQKQA